MIAVILVDIVFLVVENESNILRYLNATWGTMTIMERFAI